MNNFQRRAILAHRGRRVKENEWYSTHREYTIERVKKEFSSMIKVPLEKLVIDITAVEYKGANMSFKYDDMNFFAIRSVSSDVPGDFIDIYLLRECPRCGIVISKRVRTLGQIGEALLTPLEKDHACSIPIVVSSRISNFLGKFKRKKGAKHLFKL